jgi:serine protease
VRRRLVPASLLALGALLACPLVRAADEARVIVAFRPGSGLLRERALALVRESPEALAKRQSEQARALGGRLGLALRAGAAVAERTQVVLADGVDSKQLAARIARQPDIEYAVPDRRRRIAALPNDPLYLTGSPSAGPAVGQWYLHAPDASIPAAMNAVGAWDFSTGDASVVVAVLDTGVRFEHEDLLRAGAGGNLLPGYDLIGDAQIANDGDGRDADASDPGDWVTAAEANDPSGRFYQCTQQDPSTHRYVAENSSWHGTQTASLIAALTDNGLGMASVARTVRVLPVRVLGKCGGFDSDIIAGMRWAAGLSVPGVPDNPNPARILNLSLGGDGACGATATGSAYAAAVAELVARGVIIVASAGNDAGHAVAVPANCPGVIAVAGLRHAGTKVGFSNLGPEVALSAPGGNCVNLSGACLYPIITATNAGKTAPAAGSIYSDGSNASVGTSFSAPLVAGTAALMLAAHPGMLADDVKRVLQRSARPFPTSGGDSGDGSPVTQCQPPQAGVDQLQCYCTSSTCGAGMLDAGAALLEAVGLQARIDVSPVAPVAGQPITFSEAGSVLAPGRSVTHIAWQISDAGGIAEQGFTGASDGTTASLTPSAAGVFGVLLTIDDNTGAQSSASRTVQVQASVASAPIGNAAAGNAPAGGGGGALVAPALLALGAAVAALGRHRRQSAGLRAGGTSENGSCNSIPHRCADSR